MWCRKTPLTHAIRVRFPYPLLPDYQPPTKSKGLFYCPISISKYRFRRHKRVSSKEKNANLMQIFILLYYRAIPLTHYLRIYTKNDNNMNRKVIDYINSLKIIRQELVQ